MLTKFKYLAVDEDGSFFLYDDKPSRDNKTKRWDDGGGIECVGYRVIVEDYKDECLEDIPEEYRSMTWADEPVQIQLNRQIVPLKPYTGEEP